MESKNVLQIKGQSYPLPPYSMRPYKLRLHCMLSNKWGLAAYRISVYRMAELTTAFCELLSSTTGSLFYNRPNGEQRKGLLLHSRRVGALRYFLKSHGLLLFHCIGSGISQD